MPACYRTVLEDEGQRNFFCGLDWFSILNERLDPRIQKARIYALEDQASGKPLCILMARSERRSSFGLTHWEVQGLQNVYTLHYAPIFGPHLIDRGPLLENLAECLVDDRLRWGSLSLRMLDRTSGEYDALVASFRKAGLVVEDFFQYGNWYEDIDGRSFDQYIESRGKGIRKTLAWKVRKFERDADARYELISGVEGLEPALESFQKVYRSSWKPDEDDPWIVEQLIRSCARTGTLRLGNLYINEQPVATRLTVVSDKHATMVKTAYDEAAPKGLSLGGVLTFKVMRNLIDVDKVETIDYGIGDEPYKSKWLSKRKEKWGLVAHNPATFRGAASSAVSKARSWAKVAKTMGPPGPRPAH